MTELKVRIVVLEPMRVAAARGFGAAPEEIAWQKLRNWATSQGLLGNLTKVRFFGFNYIPPSPDRQEYGYEQWMTVGGATAGDGEVEIKDIPSASYAVTRCRLADIVETWQSLAAWCERTGNLLADRHELEECLTPELFVPETRPNALEALFDLYAPIRG